MKEFLRRSLFRMLMGVWQDDLAVYGVSPIYYRYALTRIAGIEGVFPFRFGSAKLQGL